MYSTGAAGTVGVTGAQGAYLGEGVTSGVAAWDAAAAGSTQAQMRAGFDAMLRLLKAINAKIQEN